MISRSGGEQTPLLVAARLRDLVRDSRQRARLLAIAAEGIAMMLVAAIFCEIFPHHDARFGAVGSGYATCIAINERLRVHFQFPALQNGTKSRPRSWGKKEPILAPNVRSYSYGGVSTGDGTQAIVMRRGAGFLSRSFY